MSETTSAFLTGYGHGFDGRPRDPPKYQPASSQYRDGYELGLTERVKYDIRQRSRMATTDLFPLKNSHTEGF